MSHSTEDPIICFTLLRDMIPFEASRGELEASCVSASILSRIPDNAPGYVKLACAIEAVEEYDYAVWPEKWIISSYPRLLRRAYAIYFPANPLTRSQSKSYEELYHKNPTLLETVTHGFTRKLSMNGRSAFVVELGLAGRRETSRADERNAIFEADVLHVALSYRHAASFTVGTIDQETAEEAFDIIHSMDRVMKDTTVRVWVDQNLHRYSRSGPWYERGFLPFIILPVISCLGKHGGFAICRTRPWLWVETGVALSANSIFCSPEIANTVEEIMDYDGSKSAWSKAVIKREGVIPGASFSIAGALRESLKVVSFWTPSILEHANYEYLESFKQFAQWAKAQLVRLQNKSDLDLSTDVFQNTILEDVAWIRSMCHFSRLGDVNSRRTLRTPYIRLEMESDHAQGLISLLKASATYEIIDDRIEILSGPGELDIFSLRTAGNITTFNLNPMRDFDAHCIAHSKMVQRLEAQHRCFAAYQGGCTVWDPRFPLGRPPNLTRCGNIFGKNDEMISRLDLGIDVRLGGRSFKSTSFMLCGFFAQRVYRSCLSDEIILSESDILSMRELTEDLQRRLISELSGPIGREAVARIVKAEEFANFCPSPYTMGTKGKEVLALARQRSYRDMTKPGELLIWRTRLSQNTFMLTIYDERWGHAFYSFKSLAPEGIPLEPLPSFRTGGDVDKTVEKIRLMMGAEEFAEYKQEGLSLGILHVTGKYGRYTTRFVLHGSEFQICPLCEAIFSPVNGKIAVLACLMQSRLIQVVWSNVHRCRVVGDPCGIQGPVV